MLEQECHWVAVTKSFRMGPNKWSGKKIWRVYADPLADAPPEACPYRGSRILIQPGEAPKPKLVVERRPRERVHSEGFKYTAEAKSTASSVL